MATRDVVQEIRRAARPHGATSGENLQLTSRQRQYACKSGLLEQVYPRVYVDPGTPSTPERALAAAIYAARPSAAAGAHRRLRSGHSRINTLPRRTS